MQAVFHMLHIGTLATWLSVAGLGTVAVMIPSIRQVRPILALADEIQLLKADFTIGDTAAPTDGGETAGENAEIAETLPSHPTEELIEPPALPPVADFSPLPEIPDLPPIPSPRPAISQTQTPSQALKQTASGHSASKKTGSTAGKPSGSAAGVKNGGAGSGGGLSDSARLAAGHMPAPSYPAEARRRGQTGTVIVEFTVDSNGRVIAAHAKAPSPWPLLDREAVRTVRRWKFPAGGIMKLQRPIVFKLR